MFDISFWELCVVAIIALVVIGPEQIPKVAHTVGRWVRYFRNSFAAISSEVNSEMQTELMQPYADQTLEEQVASNEPEKNNEHGN